MAKKPIVEVDEETLRSAMMGDVPALRSRQAEQEAGTQPEGEPVQEPVAVKRGPYRKKRKDEDTTYRELFLVNDGEKARVSTYVNREIHEKMKRFLPVAAPDVTLVSYINNILRHHLEQYQDEINDMYRTGINKPLVE